jgi:hypothetical protein
MIEEKKNIKRFFIDFDDQFEINKPFSYNHIL